ncbi:hypothetical protein ACN47E_007110 [Coniothyrium glycines]
MDFQRGERVTLDFDTGAVHKLEPGLDDGLPEPVFPTFVGDILEREPSLASPPVAPSLKKNVNGFPAHKKRVPRVSAFKQQRAAKEQQAVPALNVSDLPKSEVAPTPQNNEPLRTAQIPNVDAERRAIDEENQRTLAAMSDAEIEQERQELFENFSPALLQRLLMRSNIDAGSNEREFPAEQTPTAAPQTTDAVKADSESKPQSSKKVVFAEPESQKEEENTSHHTIATTNQSEPTSDLPTQPASDSIHFPAPPQPPDLDPSDPSFLQNLHEKYFPNLAYDPSHLSWMSPIDPSDKSSAYHPSHTALNASDLRFDFTGALLAPSVARNLPTDRGLHHHADAPEAAGYTVPELALLSRSHVAAQRCMAYQTLGRILYRLGRGEFGVERARQDTSHGPVRIVRDPEAEGDDGGEEDDPDDDVGSAMAGGLWRCVEEGRVIETMTHEANKARGHLTARTFAQEALWNWRRGGGRKRHAV